MTSLLPYDRAVILCSFCLIEECFHSFGMVCTSEMAGVNASAFSTKAMSTVISGKFIQHRPLMPPQTYRRMSFQMPSDRGVSTRAMAMDDSLHSGLDVALTDFIFGKKKATDVAHSVWRHVVREGDFVIDATCGNGHDTFALTKMVYEQSGKGMVYGMDVQQLALQNTSSLLDCMLSPQERKQVKLFPMCHSRMESLVPEGVSVRLVAFNLGYLPGGNKELITRSQTTVQALNAATKVLGSGGLISIMTYIGHPGGWKMETKGGYKSCDYQIIDWIFNHVGKNMRR